MPQQSSSLSIAHRVREALIRGAIWAFIGLLYAMLFIFFAALAAHWQLPINPVFLAGILAGTLGALIYSSMRLAVLMTIIIAPFSIFYFILASWPINLLYLLLIVSTIGAIIGALYGVFSMGSRVHRADAKTLAGFSAGWLASLGYLLFSSLLDNISLSTIVAFMCPITGILYVWMVPTFIKHYDDLLPPIGDGLIVGVGVSGFVALTFFVMISSVDSGVAGPLIAVLEQVRETLPAAIIGGILGGGLAGIASGLLLTDWQDL
ncbi:MAG: hypothetical protein KZQ80_05095 [Candidatus Thiodiazotropha sp. (ex Monitilora ramsayi)]|nr:hypothetical protein [Candidatus Thiodiazotropha sp. (ex Monitilora ramsayi)]